MISTVLRTGRRSRPWIVTFYSFKGGVGRTLTLVNAAFSLAARGKNVVLIDFDIDAPGLDAFPLLKATDPAPGLVEYVEEYLRAGVSPDLRRFIRRIHEAPGEGTIHIMYAGRFDETYPERLGRINWTDLYTKHNGYYFFENLKDELREQYSPDYLLIDSRTGQADVTGVATIHLPDIVVVMYALDEQNLRGAARMADAIRNNPVKKAIKVIPVASRVPTATDYSEILKSRLVEAQRRGIEPSVVLPVEPFLAFGETVLTRGYDDKQPLRSLPPLRGKIEELVVKIIASNPEDTDNLLQEAQRAFGHGDRERVWELFSSVSRSFASPRTWLEFGTLLMGTGKYDEAVRALNLAREMSPTWPEPLIKLGQASISSPSRDLSEAALYAQRYIQAGGRGFEEVFSLAHGLFRAGELAAAEPLLRWCQNSENSALKSRARLDLSLVLIAQGGLDKALELFEETFSFDPKLTQDAIWSYNYAETLRRAGRPNYLDAFKRFLANAGYLEQVLVRAMAPSGPNFIVFGESLFFQDNLANAGQALGRALALSGEKNRGRTYLEGAIQLAYQVSQTGLIFSTVSYKYETPATFIRHTQALLREDAGAAVQSPGDLFATNQ